MNSTIEIEGSIWGQEGHQFSAGKINVTLTRTLPENWKKNLSSFLNSEFTPIVGSFIKIFIINNLDSYKSRQDLVNYC